MGIAEHSDVSGLQDSGPAEIVVKSKFLSLRPLDHMPRALDILNKMNLQLTSASVSKFEDDHFAIEVVFCANSLALVETFFSRIRNFHEADNFAESYYLGAGAGKQG